MAATRVCRNERCPCGSGKKFKSCCLKVGRLSSSPSSPGFPARGGLGYGSERASFPHTVLKTPLCDDEADLRNDWKELHLDAPLEDGTALHLVLHHSERWLRNRRVGAGQVLAVNLPQVSFRGDALLTAVRPAEAEPGSEGEVKAVFHRESDEDPGILEFGTRRKPTTGSFAERCDDLRLVAMEFIEYRGRLARRVNVELLRSVEWVREQNAGIGGQVALDFPEQGIQGLATVKAIGPCPPMGQWFEKMQAGEFRRWPCRVGDLKVSSESEPIGVTPSHPFFSADRNDWVAAGRLEVGERVVTRDGTAVVEWYVMREEPEEAVYNLEIEGDHCYRVGESGILVHNSSAGVHSRKAPPDPYCRPECDVKFRVGKLRMPNPNDLTSRRIHSTDELSEKDGVYIKRHFGKIKAGKAYNFRRRYSLSDPEGGCPVWYELARTRMGPPDGLSAAEKAYWSASRQRRFDEAYLDALIPDADRYTADRETGALDPVRWRTERKIFGYAGLSDDFIRDSDD